MIWGTGQKKPFPPKSPPQKAPEKDPSSKPYLDVVEGACGDLFIYLVNRTWTLWRGRAVIWGTVLM